MRYKGKRVPKYWWDFEWNKKDTEILGVIVQSDSFPTLARFSKDSKTDSCELVIKQAVELISALDQGRVDPKYLLSVCSHER